MNRTIHASESQRQVCRGFTLIELGISLFIIALLMGFFMTATPALLNGQKIQLTRTKQALVEASLIQYALQNKRLPCPALGTLASGAANAGKAIARDVNGDCNSQTHGVAPWVELGLTATDVEDGWESRFTYRVALGLTRDNALDMSGCDPAGSAAAPGVVPNQTCAAGCTAITLTTNCTSPAAFLAGKGFTILDAVAGTTLMAPSGTPSTGAAFVLISHGENFSGGYNSNGVIRPASGPQEGTNETPNRADGAYSAQYIDASTSHSNTAAHFDDFVARPSVMTVINRAILGPRAHY